LDLKKSILSDSVRIFEQKSSLEFTLEVDISKIAICEFIEKLSRETMFSDIAVKELPMEEIITQIYNENLEYLQ
ncbi:MAG: hypothetical protein LBH16_02570, partial [Treponema sp.]|nr:hypothetical protein [Treponema sp.]